MKRITLSLITLLVVVVGINLEFTLAENTALKFDGINDVVIIPSSPSLLLANTFSFEAWVYPTNIEEDIIFSKNDRANEDYVFFIDDPTRKLGVGISVWPAGYVYGNSIIPLNKWTHVAATYNGSYVRFFVNGQPDGLRSLNRIPRISDRPLQIGRSPWGRDEVFTGVLDEIRIWNCVRTETEIIDKMCRSLTGQEPGLVGYWQLNEGADQMVSDLSVNGNDGHLGSIPQPDDNDPTWILSTVPMCENRPPVAVCQDVTVSADNACEGNVDPEEVDNGSCDPDGDPIALSLSPAGPYPLGDTTVTLTVTDDSGQADTCTATVTVEDRADTPPVITCPPDEYILADDNWEATVLDLCALATITDNCDPVPDCAQNPSAGATIPGGDTIVTLTATDEAGNSSSCEVTITVIVPLDLDIKPGSCPNPINKNLRGKGRIPMAIMGTDLLDVNEIESSSINIAGSVLPVKAPSIEDVGTPYEGEECGCNTLGGDGTNDLVIHFSRREVVLALGLDGMEFNAIVPITVEGSLQNGVQFIATDCVKIVPRLD